VEDTSSRTPYDLSDTKHGTLRIEVEAEADVADIPWLKAINLLKEQGYTIESTSFADLTLAVAAMAAGDLDIASPGSKVAWTAIGKGAPIFTFVDTYANTVMMVATRDIQTCADLDGKSVAVPGVSAVRTAMVHAFLRENCPDVKPDIVIVKGGSNRMAALLSGQVDAAAQDIDDLIILEREKPGQFHALAVFAQEFPGVQTASYLVRREFAEQHPEMVKDVIRALFTARRNLQDPGVLREAIIKHLDLEPDEAQRMADAYVAQAIWDASGRYTLEAVQASIDFFQEYGDFPPGLKAEDVADLSYYEAVLDEIGRQ
jgi:ABC-type nitrate/sulfonate/bicarbonate transport system substrate-binding protein